MVFVYKNYKMHRSEQTRRAQDDCATARQSHEAGRGSAPRKSGKGICKADKPRKINNAEWTIFEKNSYARLLMQFIMHSLPVDDCFYYHCAEKIARTPREIYAFHAAMAAHHRHAHAIVVKLLGCRLPRLGSTCGEKAGGVGRDSLGEDSINLKQVYLDSNQWSLDSAEVSFLSRLIIGDACPETEDLNEHSEVFEMTDYDCQKSLQLTRESFSDCPATGYPSPTSGYLAAWEYY